MFAYGCVSVRCSRVCINMFPSWLVLFWCFVFLCNQFCFNVFLHIFGVYVDTGSVAWIQFSSDELPISALEKQPVSLPTERSPPFAERLGQNLHSSGLHTDGGLQVIKQLARFVCICMWACMKTKGQTWCSCLCVCMCACMSVCRGWLHWCFLDLL